MLSIFLDYFFLFFIYSVIGWMMETIFVCIQKRKLVDRGFLIGPYCPIYGFGALVICLDNNITKEITNEILNFTKDSSTSRVVFRDSGFRSDADKTNIKEILKINHIEEFITI